MATIAEQLTSLNNGIAAAKEEVNSQADLITQIKSVLSSSIIEDLSSSPRVYTVSKFELLPHNVANKSIGLVKVGHPILGTWYFNESISMPYSNYYIQFSSNTQTFEQLVGYGELLYYPHADASDYVTAYHSDTKWTNPSYRSITITGYTNNSFLSWLSENAIQTQPADVYDVYIFDGNEWALLETYLSNPPTAFTVSSIDELPQDAPNGSMAIVNEVVKLATGTWVFNDELDDLGQCLEKWGTQMSPFEISASYPIENGYSTFSFFRIETIGSSSWEIYSLSYDNEGAYMHNPSGNYGITHGWTSESYKTINVSYADVEATRWLEAHATNTVEGEEMFDIAPSFYTRENGEWVRIEEAIIGSGCDATISYNSETQTLSINTIEGV